MNKVIGEGEFLLAWFVYWICTLVGGFVAGAIVGGIMGGVLGAVGADMQTIRIVGGVAGFLVSVPISFLFFRIFVGAMIVKKIESRMAQQTPLTPVAQVERY